MTNNDDEMVVTPWETRGKIDYDRLIELFGSNRISEGLKQEIYKAAGEEHFLLRRDLVYAHRDMDWIMKEYNKKNKFIIYNKIITIVVGTDRIGVST